MALFLTEQEKESEVQVRQLESRGDFKYKGITQLYQVIMKCTKEYPTKRSLPSIDYLSRTVDLKKDLIKNYLAVLIEGKIPVIREITLIEHSPQETGTTGVKQLKTQYVFCRPGVKEKYIADQYYNLMNEKSEAVLSEFFTKMYQHRRKGELETYILEHIRDNTFTDTHITFVINQLFQSPYDFTPEIRRAKVEGIVKPVMRSLIRKKVLFYGKNNSGKELAFDQFLLVQHKQELMDRFDVLLDYFYDSILPSLYKQGGLSESKISEVHNDGSFEFEIEKHIKVLELSYPYFNKSKSNTHFQIFSELFIFIPHILDSEKKDAQHKKKLMFENIINEIKGSPHVLNLKTHRFSGELLNKDQMNSLFSDPLILSADFPVQRTIGIFVAHKDNLITLVNNAGILYRNTKNDSELRILEKMGVESILEKNELLKFNTFMEESLLSYISIFKKFILILFRKKPKKADLLSVKRFLSEQDNNSIKKARKVEAEIERKKFEKEVSQKTKNQEENLKNKKNANELSPEEKLALEEEANEKAAKDKELVEKVVALVDNAWKKKELPNRLTIHRAFPEWSEEQLLAFLKRAGKSELRSFKVDLNDPKYIWPILITKRWLKQNGAKMLREAKANSDKQRSAQYPDQKSFEYWFALEDFLGRYLAKANKTG